jgi:hypothetical protein
VSRSSLFKARNGITRPPTLISGGKGFLALIAACFVFAPRFAVLGQGGWAAYSVATGLIFFASFVGIASGPGHAFIVIGFWVAVALARAWLSAVR